MFNKKISTAPKLLTFSDVMLLPGRTETDPDDVKLTSHITKRITAEIPYIASPMDTVTGAQMAIAMARIGGVGVLHRNCSIDEEVNMARQVKRAESFVITDVVTIKPDMTIKKARELMKQSNISGLPVVDDHDKVQGILTKRDVRFASDADHILVKDLMSAKVISAKRDISIEEAQKLLHKHRIEKLVVVDEEEKIEGLITVRDLERRGKYPNSTRDEDERLVVGAAIGPFDLKRAKALDPHVDFIVVDLAHGHNMNALKSAANISKEIEAELVYGNLGSKEATEDVLSIMEDVAGLRVGIGSGSICSTSVVTSASAPNLFSTLNVASALNELGSDVPVISDGGIKNPGDAALSFAAGGSSVMMGSLFAGARESPGQLLSLEGKMMKRIRGMGSRSAKAERFALDRYAAKGANSKTIPEGVEGFVPFRGNLSDIVEEFTSGVRAAFGYAGAGTVKEMWMNGKFGIISSQGAEEARPHDIYPSASGMSDGYQ